VTTKRPNIVFFMVDQMTPGALSCYGNRVSQTPHLDELSEEGVVFESAYCNGPLCVPARYSLMTGRLPSRVRAYDCGSELPSSVPTIAHYLRLSGYRTVVSGKLHYIGPDQLHGFEERLTTDVYPAGMMWTADWREGPNPQWRPERASTAETVVAAGPRPRTMNLDFDDDAVFQAKRWIYDTAGGEDGRPFFLKVSLIQPHSPFTADFDSWSRYRHDDIDMPVTGADAADRLDEFTRRMWRFQQFERFEINEDHTRNARHAYYAMVSNVDEKLGTILSALKQTNQLEDTIVVFTSDHGEMLGEHGLWYKSNFYESSVRVPLIVSAPERFKSRRVTKTVSLVDIAPTLVSLTEEQPDAIDLLDDFEGRDLTAWLRGDEPDWDDVCFAEYEDWGTVTPVLMVKEGHFKYIYSRHDPAVLYDLETDPYELTNLAGDATFASTAARLKQRILDTWDPKAIEQDVFRDQQRRLLVRTALDRGKHVAWDFVPDDDSKTRYTRTTGSQFADKWA
jgi:choline-sulfatase